MASTDQQLKAIGARVRVAREGSVFAESGRPYTQAQLAKAVGVQGNTISEIERGREPSLSVLLRIADVLSVDIAVLIRGPVNASGVPIEQGARGAPQLLAETERALTLIREGEAALAWTLNQLRHVSPDAISQAMIAAADEEPVDEKSSLPPTTPSTSKKRVVGGAGG